MKVYNGFSGICRHHNNKPLGFVREVMWPDVEGWTCKVGSEIGLNRVGPNRALSSGDMTKTAGCFALVKSDALFIDG